MEVVGVTFFKKNVSVEYRITDEVANYQYRRHIKAGNSPRPISSYNLGTRTVTHMTYKEFVKGMYNYTIGYVAVHTHLKKRLEQWITSLTTIKVLVSTVNINTILPSILKRNDINNVNCVCDPNTIDILKKHGNDIKYVLAWYDNSDPTDYYRDLVSTLNLSTITLYSLENVNDTTASKYIEHNVDLTDYNFGTMTRYTLSNERLSKLFSDVNCKLEIPFVDVLSYHDDNNEYNDHLINHVHNDFESMYEDKWTSVEYFAY